jgi:hypothetical protein
MSITRSTAETFPERRLAQRKRLLLWTTSDSRGPTPFRGQCLRYTFASCNVAAARSPELRGNDAKAYAEGHLEEVEKRLDAWQIVYCCRETDASWLADYPASEQHGGGSMRLRRCA